MVGDPLGRLGRDMEAAARDLADLDQPAQELSDRYAEAIRGQVPVVSGFLRGSVYSDSSGVGLSAPYAGVINDSNPYVDRALGQVDETEPFAAYVDEVLDNHLTTLYV